MAALLPVRRPTGWMNFHVLIIPARQRANGPFPSPDASAIAEGIFCTFSSEASPMTTTMKNTPPGFPSHPSVTLAFTLALAAGGVQAAG
ncbi:hypothetical protein, partial [Azotobacter vinelandii]|uniref:hypothetical protein n=1 Tax=Azotobacter vinelandii TaxID=354 RepID=UPI001E36FB7A